MSDASTRGPSAVGLPDQVRVCLFDLDGVLTRTAAVHATAWKDTFDAYLRQRADAGGETFRGFDIRDDYNAHVDGKPRGDGVRDFLRSRGIELDEGTPDDPAGTETVHGIGNRKNEALQRRIHDDGVEVFDGSVRYVHAVRDAGLATGVVSSSANTHEVLRITGMADLFGVVVDANLAREAGLAGKPAPDTFLEGASRAGAGPEATAVFEDALAGVQAGRAGGFAYVIGVDRVGQADQLRDHGAHVVVADLAELLP